MKTLRLAILGSTRGTNMLQLISAIQQRRLSATIELVLSDRETAIILERAKEHHIPAFFVNPAQKTREIYDRELLAIIDQYAIDLIVLIGYMRILSQAFVEKWHQRIINVHPSLLPAFAGGMDKKVHQAVLDAGVSETGCTVHIVTEDVDAGPILVQKKCIVLPEDTIDSLRSRVQALESDALIEAINHYVTK